MQEHKGGPVFFNNETKFNDLPWDNPAAMICEFEKRIRNLYLEPAEMLATQIGAPFGGKAGLSFAVGLMCLCTIDALARFEYGGNGEERLKKWLKNYSSLNELQREYLYTNFRCKLVHEGRILAGCFVCENFHDNEIMNVQSLQNDKRYIKVSPITLLNCVREGFGKYLQHIRQNTEEAEALLKHLKEDFKTERLLPQF